MATVLIVDDSPADRTVFRTLLTRAGFTVHEAAYGREAIPKAREFRPHLIVLDVNLPDTDGHAVCRLLRQDPQLANVPILMLTVRDNTADVLAGLEAGADDYVAKDAPSEIILARVRRLARYRQMAAVAGLNEHLVQVGKLLAGIIHEIRGPLSVIRGNAEIVRLQLGESHPLDTRVEPIIRSCQLLQLRLEHLMAAVRGGPPVLESIDISSLISEAADLFQKGTDPREGKITIVTELSNALPPVHADAGRLIQVLLNLLGNSTEAILATCREGRITLSAQEKTDADGGHWVVVEVSDNGPGIPENLLDRVFEPFFTTKETGSGYGLYLASEILKEHGGRLTAHNREEGGATFCIWLTPAPSDSRDTHLS